MAACDGQEAETPAAKTAEARWQFAPAPAPWEQVPPPPSPGPVFSLLIVDQDAGAPLPEGGRAGALFVANPSSPDVSGHVFKESHLSLVATDPRWVDPADALQLPDESWLVLESKWAPGPGDARGAIFRLPKLDATPELWWTDARSRQPVALVRDEAGTIFVSDRDADPDDVRAAEPGRQRTGCVFGIEVGADGRPARTEVIAAGKPFFTPGALFAFGPLLYVMDADANPRGLHMADGRLATRLTAIDPAPRAALAGLPVEWLRDAVPGVGMAPFAALAPGDFLFIDSSHVLMPGSDVDFLINRLLPGLPPGVLVHLHDIFLPDDYPA